MVLLFCCRIEAAGSAESKGKGCINAGTLPSANSVHILKIDTELTLVESTRIISIVAKGEETVNCFFIILFYFILYVYVEEAIFHNWAGAPMENG